MSAALTFAAEVVPDTGPVPGHYPDNGDALLARPLASITTLRPPGEIRTAAPVRLTRRGIAVLSAALAVAGVVLVWLATRSAPVPSAAPGVRAVTVRSGDTLWSIATRIAPQRDPRVEVQTLQRANHLGDVDLVPGQLLHVP